MQKPMMTGYALLFSLLTFADPLDSIHLSSKEEAQLIRQFNSQLDSTDKRLKFRAGNISLADGRIRIYVPSEFRFINAQQTRFILEQLWGNAPDTSIAGMVVKNNFSVNRLSGDYSFVIGFNEIGYVQEMDAKKLDADELLGALKDHMETANEKRSSFGYPAMKIEGWAKEPFYDASRHILSWATVMTTAGSDEKILNYEVRMLGRSGVMSINAVATMDQLEDIRVQLPLLIEQAAFEEGFQYDDFKSEREPSGTWQLSDLITGKAPEQVAGNKGSSWKWFSLAGIAIAGGLVFSIFKRKAPSRQA